MSAHTDCVYLREINRGEREAMGEAQASTMNLVLRGLNFRQLTSAVTAGDDDLARAVAQDAIRDVQRAAIDFLVVTANTVSGMPDALREVITVPVLDIVAPVFVQADNDGASRLGLLSTSATARSGIYQAAAADHGCEVLLPPAQVSDAIDDAIFSRLTHGLRTEQDAHAIVDAITWFGRHSVDAVILGCTDLTLPADQLSAVSPLPLLDSAVLPARAAHYVAMTGDLDRFRPAKRSPPSKTGPGRTTTGSPAPRGSAAERG